MVPTSQDLALDIADRFTVRTMERERSAILYAIKSFRTLDVMVDQDDLWQEAWIGVNNAHHTWDDARAINMQFRTFVIWHVKRHFQGLYLSSDKVVDLIDPVSHTTIITLPYARYCKQGRRIARERRYTPRIRSLKVYYEQSDEDDTPRREPVAVTPQSSTSIADLADPKDTHVMDIYNPQGLLVVTVPIRTFLKKQPLIEQQGLLAQRWCIYEPRPEFQGSSCLPSPSRREVRPPSPAQPIVVDIYTRRGAILLRTTPDRYKPFRKEFEERGCLIRYHDVTRHPTQPPYEDIEHDARPIKSIRQLRQVVNS